MKIPRDLKPGDAVIDHYGGRHITQPLRHGSPYDTDGDIWTSETPDSTIGLYFRPSGIAYNGVRAHRIERIASAKPNRRLAAAKEPLPRSIIRSILRWEKERRGGETQMSEAVRIVRAIARWLENKKCPANASPAVGGSAGRTGSSRAVSRNSRAAGVAVE